MRYLMLRRMFKENKELTRIGKADDLKFLIFHEVLDHIENPRWYPFLVILHRWTIAPPFFQMMKDIAYGFKGLCYKRARVNIKTDRYFSKMFQENKVRNKLKYYRNPAPWLTVIWYTIGLRYEWFSFVPL